jgi:hypothetical protein
MHGASSITPDTMTKIKNSFVNRTQLDAAYVVDSIFEKYNCSGEPECTWRYRVEAEMVLNGGAQVHERELRAA